MASRFADPVSDNRESELRSSAVPEKTKATTQWGVRVWRDWAQARITLPTDLVNRVAPCSPLMDMPPDDLAYWMGKFVLEVRKQDGKEYPPKSLYALVCCIKRHFEENGIYNINPLCSTNDRFGDFRRTLDAEMKRLHGMGLGTTSKQAEPITPDEEALLWSSEQFGTHNAQALVNTVYFYNSKVFGLRSYDEHRNLKRAQFTKKVDELGRVYLEYVDHGSKTNRGGLKTMKVDNKVIRQYEDASDEEHCVVNIFVKYLLYLPSEVDYFYCRPLPNDSSGIPRFGKQPVGRNKLAQIIPQMCQEAGIGGRKTGHSGKVTCATTLYHKDFGDQLIKERTGHRSLEALHKYKRTGVDQQYKVSMALLPSLTSGKENAPKQSNVDVAATSDDDDFVPLKKPKINPEDIKSLFPQSSLNNCTVNIQFSK